MAGAYSQAERRLRSSKTLLAITTTKHDRRHRPTLTSESVTCTSHWRTSKTDRSTWRRYTLLNVHHQPSSFCKQLISCDAPIEHETNDTNETQICRFRSKTHRSHFVRTALSGLVDAVGPDKRLTLTPELLSSSPLHFRPQLSYVIRIFCCVHTAINNAHNSVSIGGDACAEYDTTRQRVLSKVDSKSA